MFTFDINKNSNATELIFIEMPFLPTEPCVTGVHRPAWHSEGGA